MKKIFLVALIGILTPSYSNATETPKQVIPQYKVSCNYNNFVKIVPAVKTDNTGTILYSDRYYKKEIVRFSSSVPCQITFINAEEYYNYIDSVQRDYIQYKQKRVMKFH
jgi:hypothetical protein